PPSFPSSFLTPFLPPPLSSFSSRPLSFPPPPLPSSSSSPLLLPPSCFFFGSFSFLLFFFSFYFFFFSSSSSFFSFYSSFFFICSSSSFFFCISFSCFSFLLLFRLVLLLLLLLLLLFLLFHLLLIFLPFFHLFFLLLILILLLLLILLFLLLLLLLLLILLILLLLFLLLLPLLFFLLFLLLFRLVLLLLLLPLFPLSSSSGHRPVWTSGESACSGSDVGPPYLLVGQRQRTLAPPQAGRALAALGLAAFGPRRQHSHIRSVHCRLGRFGEADGPSRTRRTDRGARPGLPRCSESAGQCNRDLVRPTVGQPDAAVARDRARPSLRQRRRFRREFAGLVGSTSIRSCWSPLSTHSCRDRPVAIALRPH
ncbi:unnamed protein product, partial [Protopolystoma xenopodis]